MASNDVSLEKCCFMSKWLSRLSISTQVYIYAFSDITDQISKLATAIIAIFPEKSSQVFPLISLFNNDIPIKENHFSTRKFVRKLRLGESYFSKPFTVMQLKHRLANGTINTSLGGQKWTEMGDGIA